MGEFIFKSPILISYPNEKLKKGQAALPLLIL